VIGAGVLLPAAVASSMHTASEGSRAAIRILVKRLFESYVRSARDVNRSGTDVGLDKAKQQQRRPRDEIACASTHY
jgi:hypothetical protein